MPRSNSWNNRKMSTENNGQILNHFWTWILNMRNDIKAGWSQRIGILREKSLECSSCSSRGKKIWEDGWILKWNFENHVAVVSTHNAVPAQQFGVQSSQWYWRYVRPIFDLWCSFHKASQNGLIFYCKPAAPENYRHICRWMAQSTMYG